MSRFFHGVAARMQRKPHGLIQTKQSGRCDLVEYLGTPFARSSAWLKPATFVATVGYVGPVAFGLAHPWCSDCSGCNALQMSSDQEIGMCRVKQVEYLPLEFALDVAQQTSHPGLGVGESSTTQVRSVLVSGPDEFTVSRSITDTRRWTTPPFPSLRYSLLFFSQETYFEYIAATYPSRGSNACFVSADIHDLAIPNITHASIAGNTMKLLAMAKSVCSRVVFLIMSATRDDPRPQRNFRIVEVKNMVTTMLRDGTSFRDVAIIDVFNMTNPSTMHLRGGFDMHADNVHLIDTYYNYLASFLTGGLL